MDIYVGEHLFTILRGKLCDDLDIRRLHYAPRAPQKLGAFIASIIPLARPDSRKTVLIVHTRCSIVRAEGVSVRLRTMTMLVEAFLREVFGTSCPAAIKVSEQGSKGGNAYGEDCEIELKASLQCQQWSVESRSNDRLRGPERFWNRGVCRQLSVSSRPIHLAVFHVHGKLRLFFVTWGQWLF